MTDAGFNRVFENLVMGVKEVVPPKEAHSWIFDNIVGTITKEKLEKERFKEVNSQDMMSSALIIYHMESLLEMQFLCLITFAFVLKPEVVEGDTINYALQEKSDQVLFVLISEHLFSYISGYFRTWEIKKYGKVDINGVARAQKETLLKTFEVFIDCLIFGWTMNHIFSMTWKEF